MKIQVNDFFFAYSSKNKFLAEYSFETHLHTQKKKNQNKTTTQQHFNKMDTILKMHGNFSSSFFFYQLHFFTRCINNEEKQIKKPESLIQLICEELTFTLKKNMAELCVSTQSSILKSMLLKTNKNKNYYDSQSKKFLNFHN